MKKYSFYIPIIVYAFLCIFSIIAVIMHLTGSRTFMTLELSKSYILKIDDIERFLNITNAVAFIVGILRGLAAFSIFKLRFYFLPLVLSALSIISVIVKMSIDFNAFQVVKLVLYLILFVILIINSKRFGKKEKA